MIVASASLKDTENPTGFKSYIALKITYIFPCYYPYYFDVSANFSKTINCVVFLVNWSHVQSVT